MSDKTLKDLAKAMKAIDFTMLSTYAANGAIAARPMSNNGDVEYDGDSWFYAMEDTTAVTDIQGNPRVGLTLQGAKGLLGQPGVFIAIEGVAELIRDKATLDAHWIKDLERWFDKGTETPGLVLIKAHAERIHYWDGEDQGEVRP
ncbi:pyridoxamine 5'-phosphate oxidase family protein [Brevundimonas sp.]|uniref:pyridoxamine 5'-phosphate oxidase family protein n=1 Tax=Brevundimonas sp. TaxID=1871086 RepID=UPI003BAAF801